MNNKVKLILRNSTRNPGSKSIILTKSLQRARQITNEIIESLGQSKIISKTKASNDIQEIVLNNTSTILILLNSEHAIRGYRANFLYLNDEFDEKTIREVAMPFISVNFDPIERQKAKEFEDELIRLQVISEDERTKCIDNQLIDLTKI